MPTLFSMSSSDLQLDGMATGQEMNNVELSVTNLKSLELALPISSPRFSTLRPVSQKTQQTQFKRLHNRSAVHSTENGKRNFCFLLSKEFTKLW